MVVYECEIQTYCNLSKDQQTKAIRALNKHYTGSETIPLETPYKDISKELLEATCAVVRANLVNIKVKVHHDGSLEIVNFIK